MPSFFTDGNTPARSDGMWKIEQKILGALNDLVAIGGGGTAAGFGSPEGVVAAVPGTIYTDRNPPYDIYTKVSGSGNTGWIMKVE